MKATSLVDMMLACVTCMASLAAPLLAGANIQFLKLQRSVIEDRLRLAPGEDSSREVSLHKIFEQAGCTAGQLLELPVKHSKLPNVVCTLVGETTRIIIVGGHFDHVTAGGGFVDNWSGASLLPSLYESLKTVLRRHTFVFIGFTDEEKGLIGSRAYVHALSKEEAANISGMVNLDSLGTSTTKLELNRGSKVLANALAAVAQYFKLPLTIVDVHAVGRSDSDSFQDRKIPALNLHSLTQETWPILHTNQDQLAAIQLDAYFDSYRLITAYLAYLDVTLDANE